MRLLLLDLVDDGARYIVRGVVSIAAFPAVLDERLFPRPCPVEVLSEPEKRFVTGLCGQARRNGTSDQQRLRRRQGMLSGPSHALLCRERLAFPEE